MSRRPIIITVIAGVLATAIGIFLSYVIHWFPVAASAQAKNTDRLYHVLVIASIPIFVIVVATILYSVWQFRMKPGEELKDGPPIHGNTRLEVLWTAVPSVLVIALVSYSFVVLHENEEKPPGKEIQVGGDRPAILLVLQVPDRGYGGRAGRAATSSTCRRASRCTSTCTPRTSSTPSTSRRSACRRTWCRASRPTIA